MSKIDFNEKSASAVKQYCENLALAIDRAMGKPGKASKWKSIAQQAFLPEDVTEIVVKTICEDSNLTDWAHMLLRDIIGPSHAISDDRIARLHNCLNAIPDMFGYICLCEAYGGVPKKTPRPGRNESYDNVLEDNREIREIFQRNAMRFMRHTERINYIICGQTDLTKRFQDSHIKTLNANSIYVLNDIETRTPEELLTLKIENPQVDNICGTIFRIKQQYYREQEAKP